MKIPRISLNNEDAIVLQQISELGEEDVIGLEKSLGMSRGRVMASIESLRRKGLISVHHISGDWWVNLSQRGKQLTHYMWPEMAPVRVRV